MSAQSDISKRSRKTSGWTLGIGRIAGIEIRLHVTFLLLMPLLIWSETQPGGLGVLGGLVWVTAIFVSVLMHELAHSFVARNKGATVDSIVLLPIGGISRLRNLPTGWSDELTIAAVGPLASLGIAVVAAIMSVVVGQHLLPVNIYGGSFLPRLAWVNLLLGVFNLLPAFPLDGGRVFRALLERRRDPLDATYRASWLGHLLAAIMILLGFYWNLWLLIIGLFVWFGASAEVEVTRLHAVLRGRTVRELMHVDAAVVDASWPVRALDLVPHPAAQHQFAVTQQGAYLGLVDDHRVRGANPDLPLGTMADTSAPALEPSEDLGLRGLDDLIESGYPALAVVDDGRVVGLLRLRDVESLAEHTRAA
jgi:Zn-dependent protease